MVCIILSTFIFSLTNSGCCISFLTLLWSFCRMEAKKSFWLSMPTIWSISLVYTGIREYIVDIKIFLIFSTLSVIGIATTSTLGVIISYAHFSFTSSTPWNKSASWLSITPSCSIVSIMLSSSFSVTVGVSSFLVRINAFCSNENG